MTAAEVRDDQGPLPATPRPRNCPHCGANCWDDDATCWHCRRNLASPPRTPHLIQFSLGMLLLLTAAIAVALGAARSFPLVTVLLLLWILPAILHAYLACRLLRGRIPPVELGERLDRFGLALVYVCLAFLAAVAVGWMVAATLWTFLPRNPVFPLDAGPADVFHLPLVGIALLCASFAGGWMFWITLPRVPKRSA